CYALFEHMMPAERSACFDALWQKLRSGGHLVVYETPNRIWPYDSHTTQLYGWQWLPPRWALWYGKRRRKFSQDADLETMYREGYGMTWCDWRRLLDDKPHTFVAGTDWRGPRLKRAIGKTLGLLLLRPRWTICRYWNFILRKA
ncbi:MAG: hypothetical protein ACRELF_27465, partial [Gemmataceae bacterium]